MNVVISAGRIQVFGEGVVVANHIDPGTYNVEFSKNIGFYLTHRDNLDPNEDKIYGNTEQKVNKIFKSYDALNRNFGVILSGPKGVGKTLFTRILTTKAISERNMPVIIVRDYIPGIADFIGSIEQEVVVIFDEFEKTFANSHDGDIRPQEEMLPLFDGLDNGRKIFVITCNYAYKLNECLMNRPGRFHYHFVMKAPDPSEIEEYLHDKLNESYWSEIKNVIHFSQIIDITYDVLRAIAFELNQGYKFVEVLEDLNINKGETPTYDVVIKLENGQTLSFEISTDIVSSVESHRWIDLKVNGKVYDVYANLPVGNDISYDPIRNCFIGNCTRFNVERIDEDFPIAEEVKNMLLTLKAIEITYTRKVDSNKLTRYLMT